MAKRKENQNIKAGAVVRGQSSAKKQKPGSNGSFIDRFSHTTLIIVISLITWAFFKNALDNKFTDWDDKGYILTDNIIRDFSLQGLEKIFTTPVMGHYHPITILIYTIEYHLVQFSPLLYHFDSVFFHTLTVILAYWFAYLLIGNKTTAVITSILFAIHPMHVESVAWVAGRKDVLCTLFYFGSCIAYLFYIRAPAGKKKVMTYIATFALYIGALLCKEIAVTLPVVLLILDYYEKRPWKIPVFVEKLPFFILAIFFGILSIKISHESGVLDINRISYTFLDRINLMAYALFIYLWKAVVPVNLHNFYAYPGKVNGSLPYYYYVFPLLIAGLAYVAWHFRNKKEIVFGILFFLANIILLIKFVPVGDAIAAERYSYTSYFGLFFIAGSMLSAYVKPGGNRYAVYFALVIYFIVIGFVSAERCKTWYDASTLWSDEIQKEPEAAISYNNLGFFYFERHATDASPATQQLDFDSALILMSKAVAIKSDYTNSIEGLGILYFMRQNMDSSVRFFGDFVRLKPCSESYYDYGLTLYHINKKDSAFIDYSQSILLDSTNWKPLLNRGVIYKEQNRFDDAMNDFNKAIKIDSTQANMYYERSYCYMHDGDKKRALQDVEKAISLGFNQVDSRYYNSLKNE